MKITAILYDADGVLTKAIMMFSDLLARDYGISFAVTQGFFRGPFQDCLVGTKDIYEELPKYLNEWGWKGSVEDFTQLWFKSEHSIEDAVIEHVDAIRAKGIKCYVATNQEKHRANYMLEEMGFKNHFDGIFASAHLGAKKPEHEFFKTILDKLNLTPQEVLFWDDSEENIVGALGVGLHAEHFKGLKEYKTVMKEKYGL